MPVLLRIGIAEILDFFKKLKQEAPCFVLAEVPGLVKGCSRIKYSSNLKGKLR